MDPAWIDLGRILFPQNGSISFSLLDPWSLRGPELIEPQVFRSRGL